MRLASLQPARRPEDPALWVPRGRAAAHRHQRDAPRARRVAHPADGGRCARSASYTYLFGHQRPGSAPFADAKAVLDWSEAEPALLEDLEVLRRNRVDEPDSVLAPEE